MHGELQRLASPPGKGQLDEPSLELDGTLASQDPPDYLHVLASEAQRVLEGRAVPALHHLRP